MEGKYKRKRARTIRYTLLLTPREFDWATKIAKQEYRTLPDFFRVQIYRSATALGIDVRSEDYAAPQCVAASE